MWSAGGEKFAERSGMLGFRDVAARALQQALGEMGQGS